MGIDAAAATLVGALVLGLIFWQAKHPSVHPVDSASSGRVKLPRPVKP
jgi:hypothetical protein